MAGLGDDGAVELGTNATVEPARNPPQRELPHRVLDRRAKPWAGRLSLRAHLGRGVQHGDAEQRLFAARFDGMAAAVDNLV